MDPRAKAFPSLDFLCCGGAKWSEKPSIKIDDSLVQLKMSSRQQGVVAKLNLEHLQDQNQNREAEEEKKGEQIIGHGFIRYIEPNPRNKNH